jgi:hypothetical protein
MLTAMLNKLTTVVFIIGLIKGMELRLSMIYHVNLICMVGHQSWVFVFTIAIPITLANITLIFTISAIIHRFQCLYSTAYIIRLTQTFKEVMKFDSKGMDLPQVLQKILHPLLPVMEEKHKLIVSDNLSYHRQLLMVLEQYMLVLPKHQLLLLLLGVSIIKNLLLIN